MFRIFAVLCVGKYTGNIEEKKSTFQYANQQQICLYY